MSKKAILFSEMTPQPEWETEFNAWYDTEHIPIRMGAPGFDGAQRYRKTDGSPYLAVYELASPVTLSTPAYRLIKGQPSERTKRMLSGVSGFTRYVGEEISCFARPAGTGMDAPILYAVFFNVPSDRIDEFDRWYEEDHIPTLLKCPAWLMVRRFDIVDGEPGPFNRLALHYLASSDALASPEREEARASPWRAKLAEENWFKGQYTVFDKIGKRFLPQA